jgi:hypothetical protein
MSYLQTNTRLENLEVVERVGITLHHDWHYGGKQVDILIVNQFSTFNTFIIKINLYLLKRFCTEVLSKIIGGAIGS